MNLFDVSDQLHGVEPSEELLKAERELQEESDRSSQMRAACIVLVLIGMAIWAGWRAW